MNPNNPHSRQAKDAHTLKHSKARVFHNDGTYRRGETPSVIYDNQPNNGRQLTDHGARMMVVRSR